MTTFGRRTCLFAAKTCFSKQKNVQISTRTKMTVAVQLHIHNTNFLTGSHSMFSLVDKMLLRAPFTRNNSFVFHQRVTKLLLGAMGWNKWYIICHCAAYNLKLSKLELLLYITNTQHNIVCHFCGIYTQKWKITILPWLFPSHTLNKKTHFAEGYCTLGNKKI